MNSITVTIVGPDNEEGPGFPEIWLGQLTERQTENLRGMLAGMGMKEPHEMQRG